MRSHLLRPRQACRVNGGFSLIEVVMAMAVLGFALMSSLLVIRVAAGQLDHSRMSNAATQAMQGEIERIRLLNWANLPASGAVDLSGTFPAGSQVVSRLSLIRSVSDVSGTGTPANIKEIVLTATWTALDGTPRIRTFRMQYGKNGLYDYYYGSG